MVLKISFLQESGQTVQLTQQDVNGILATYRGSPATVEEKDVLDSVAEVGILKTMF